MKIYLSYDSFWSFLFIPLNVRGRKTQITQR